VKRTCFALLGLAVVGSPLSAQRTQRPTQATKKAVVMPAAVEWTQSSGAKLLPYQTNQAGPDPVLLKMVSGDPRVWIRTCTIGSGSTVCMNSQTGKVLPPLSPDVHLMVGGEVGAKFGKAWALHAQYAAGVEAAPLVSRPLTGAETTALAGRVPQSLVPTTAADLQPLGGARQAPPRLTEPLPGPALLGGTLTRASTRRPTSEWRASLSDGQRVELAGGRWIAKFGGKYLVGQGHQVIAAFPGTAALYKDARGQVVVRAVFGTLHTWPPWYGVPGK